MNVERLTANVTAHVGRRVEQSVTRIMADAAADLRELVAKPVERSGSKIIRSKPGEPPRRETGKYQGSITHRVTRTDDHVRGAAGSPMPGRPAWLQRGTSRMRPRPHYNLVYETVKATAARRIRENI